MDLTLAILEAPLKAIFKGNNAGLNSVFTIENQKESDCQLSGINTSDTEWIGLLNVNIYPTSLPVFKSKAGFKFRVYLVLDWLPNQGLKKFRLPSYLLINGVGKHTYLYLLKRH